MWRAAEAMTDDVWRRVHPCTDHAGRVRELAIIVDDGTVSLHTPPGEVATFQPQGVGPLRKDFADAQAEAIRQRGCF